MDGFFVHTEVVISNPAELADPSKFGSGQGHALSPALTSTFLPERKNFMLGQLNLSSCACVNRFRALPPARARGAAASGRGLLVPAATNRGVAGASARVARHTTPDPERKTGGRYRGADAGERPRQARCRQTEESGLPVPAAAPVKAETLKFPPSLVPRNKPDTERVARQKAVLRLLEQEPPRRTVTGSFAVH